MTAKPVGMEAAVRRIEMLLAEQEHVFVAIDGPCASGKTTLSRNLNERFGGNVLHMDDFFLRSVRLPGLVKVLVAQLAGRVVLTVATAIAVFAFGSTNAIAATWTSDLAAGLPGLALQWALIPLAAYWTESLIAKRGR
ncbi:(d)CMP kinase [Bifidobacterium angulatum]|uniref:(d)CMP kinase n=1 Tax=Bifidobacterium angulatum TaxID=1683 RepID=UPI0009E839B4|nr:(d)CMP kinase [Bifidobacterium angulatum]